MKRNEDNLRDLWDNIKCTNIEVQEGGNREKGAENKLEDIIAENWPKMGKETHIQSRKHRESHKGQIQGETRQDTY